jgi:hypothetical protein
MPRKVFLAIACLGLAAGLAAAPFEGKIDYQLTTAKGQSGTFTLSSKGSKIRQDFSMGGQSGASIMDFGAKQIIMLMPQRQSYMEQPIPDQPSQAPSGVTIAKSGATDTIAGYTAYEWIATSPRGKTSLWINQDLGDQIGHLGGGKSKVDIPEELKKKGGILLKMTGAKGMTLVATKVSTESLPNSLFEVPAGYTKMDLGALGGAAGATGAPSAGAGAGAGTMGADDPRVQKAMENMTPAQKAMIQQMMQKQAAAGAGAGN